MNVLITSASRKVSLVHAFQEALSTVGGGKVVGVDISPLAAALYVADEGYLIPRSEDAKFLPALLRLCRDRKIGLVIPTRDEELPFFAQHRGEFAGIGTEVMVPGLETVKICQDKYLFARFCRDNGLLAPRMYDQGEKSRFPLFVKPRRGKGSKFTFRVEDAKALDGVLAFLGSDVVIQEYLDAPEYTIDLFADLSGNIISVVPRERLVTFGGESFVGKTVKNPLIRDQAIGLAQKLDLIGHNTIQCFLRDEEVLFIEVNPRYGGGAHLGFAAGAPTPEWLLRLLQGERLEPRIDDYKVGYYMLRHTEDIFLEEASLAQRGYGG